jgi:competence protein ComEA
MTTQLETRTLLPIVRRATALMALCVLIAAATATWLTSDPAQAGPRLDLPARTGDQAARAELGTTTDQAMPAKSNTRVAQSKADDDDGQPAKTKKTSGKVITGKLNLNTASEDQLRMLPGVGPAKAQRIIEYRTSRGKFKRVRDLRRVKGFGYKTVTKLTPYLAVQGETTLKVE